MDSPLNLGQYQAPLRWQTSPGQQAPTPARALGQGPSLGTAVLALAATHEKAKRSLQTEKQFTEKSNQLLLQMWKRRTLLLQRHILKLIMLTTWITAP